MPAGKRSIRYAVVGLGHIAQVAVLPAFAHARRNSKLVAVVSDDAAKRREIAKRYKLDHAFSYDEFDDCLEVVDAVYIALPNSMHAEYTIRAARAGVHVLCEKPMAVTVKECGQMIAACRRASVKLMIAYRLHFEALNLEAIDLARKGLLGALKFFNSSFSMTVRRGDIRTKRAHGGGSLYDIGVVLHQCRPQPVSRGADPGVGGGNQQRPGVACRDRRNDRRDPSIRRRTGRHVHHQLQCVRRGGLSDRRHERRPPRRPCVRICRGARYRLTIDGKTTRKAFAKHDQFAPELLYFSDCILKNRQPEPSGEEGRQDVRIVQALYKSAGTGRPVAIPPFTKRIRPTGRQRITRPGLKKPRLVKVQSASGD